VGERGRQVRLVFFFVRCFFVEAYFSERCFQRGGNACASILSFFLGICASLSLSLFFCVRRAHSRALSFSFILSRSLDANSNFDSIIEQAEASRQRGEGGTGTSGGNATMTTQQTTVNNNYVNGNAQSQQQLQQQRQMGSISQQQKNNNANLEEADAHFLQSRVRDLERRDKDKDGMLSLLRSRLEQYEKEIAKLQREVKDAATGGGQSGRIVSAQGQQQQSGMAMATSYANTSAAHHVAAEEIRKMRKEIENLKTSLGFKEEELQEAQENQENARRRSRREKQELMNEIYALKEQVKKRENEVEEQKLQKKKRNEDETGPESEAKRRKQNVESGAGVSVSDAIKRFNSNDNINQLQHSLSTAANAANFATNRQAHQQNKNMYTTKRTESLPPTTTTTIMTTTFKDVSDWQPMLPKAPKGLFDQASMAASALYHNRGNINYTADIQGGTSSKKFAFFLDSFAKSDALVFLGFHTKAVEKGVTLASLRRKNNSSNSSSRHNKSKKIGSGLRNIEEGWEYHSVAIGRALASVFLDDEVDEKDDNEYQDGTANSTGYRNDSINEVFSNANFLITLLEALKSVAAFDGDKELNPQRNEYADDNARDELAASAARLLLVLLKNDRRCCRRVIEARRRNLLRNLSTSQSSTRGGANEDDEEDDSEEEEDMMITDKVVAPAATTVNARGNEKKKVLRRRINGSEFDIASACTSSFAGGSLVPHPLSTTGRVFVHTKVQVPADDYISASVKGASKSKKGDASSSAPLRSATAVVDEKFDAVTIIVDCLRRCVGARAWEATAPLLGALTWLTSFAASEFTNGRDLVGSRVLPSSELVMTSVPSRRAVPTTNGKTGEEKAPQSGAISAAKQTQGMALCWMNSCLKANSPQDTRMACLSLIRTLSTCKSFQDALNEYAVLSDVVSVLRNEIPSTSTNIMDIAMTQDQNVSYMNYTCSRSRELVDMSLRVLAAFAHLDWKGWPRVVRKENVLAAAANTALWEMAIQKTKTKTRKTSTYKAAPASGISARVLRYALIMIAHILSVTETQESAMRMLAENPNLSRMMARCARGAGELGPTEVKIGAFVMKCVEKAARTQYYYIKF